MWRVEGSETRLASTGSSSFFRLMKFPLTKQITYDIGYSANLLDLCQSCSCLVLLGIWRSPRLYQVCPFELASVEPPCTCAMCSTCMGSFDFSCLIWEHKLVQPCIFHAHSQVHNPISLYLLPWGRYEEAVQTNNISRPPEQK